VGADIKGHNITPVRGLVTIFFEGDPHSFVCKVDLKNPGIKEDEVRDGVETVNLATASTHMLERETIMCQVWICEDPG
jgi:hypothetical protein